MFCSDDLPGIHTSKRQNLLISLQVFHLWLCVASAALSPLGAHWLRFLFFFNCCYVVVFYFLLFFHTKGCRKGTKHGSKTDSVKIVIPRRPLELTRAGHLRLSFQCTMPNLHRLGNVKFKCRRLWLHVMQLA